MRAYRQMKTLAQRGHRVTLKYLGYGRSMAGTEDDFWMGKTKIFEKNYPHSHYSRTLFTGTYRKKIRKWIAEEDYDIVHVYSSPDVLGASAVKSSNIPVVFDERDVVTALHPDMLLGNYIPPWAMKSGIIRSIGKNIFIKRLQELERTANEKSSARVFLSHYAYDLIRSKYNIPDSNNLVIYNYAMKSDIKKSLPKLSAETGETHIVYEGVLSLSGYREPLLSFLVNLSKMNIHVHVYGIGSDEVNAQYKKYERNHPYYHFHGMLPKDKLMSEMTQYDFGLLPFPSNDRDKVHLDTGLSNKLFDYLICGLPIIVPTIKSMVNFVEEERVGYVFDDINQIPEITENTPVNIDRKRYSLENHIGDLEMIYQQILK